MEFIKESRMVTQRYTVVDGPIVDTDPRRLAKGRFRVEVLTISWLDGAVGRVFVRGQAVLADGRKGKLKHDRDFYGSDIPDWVDELLDIDL